MAGGTAGRNLINQTKGFYSDWSKVFTNVATTILSYNSAFFLIYIAVTQFFIAFCEQFDWAQEARALFTNSMGILYCRCN